MLDAYREQNSGFTQQGFANTGNAHTTDILLKLWEFCNFHQLVQVLQLMGSYTDLRHHDPSDFDILKKRQESEFVIE